MSSKNTSLAQGQKGQAEHVVAYEHIELGHVQQRIFA